MIGVCSHIATGSSAVTDLLREFEETQVLDSIEFIFTYFPDGLEDLEYHVKNYHKYMSSVVAINRFRKFMNRTVFKRATCGQVNKAVETFLNNIIQFSWNGHGAIDTIVCSSRKMFIRKCAFRIANRPLLRKLFEIYLYSFCYKMELSIAPDKFDEASKNFVTEILNAMGQEPCKITVLDQSFEGCNPVKSFKYFENPKAIVVDRDPRDHYLFVKNFLRPRGIGFQIPCDNVDDYIKYYRLIRKYPPGLQERNDIFFLNFEELIYNYENTIKKISDFVGATQHLHKGTYFKPTHSRSNTQLFKKYAGFEEDIVKIESNLSEYLFHFENYPDMESEGGMFWGSQSRKKR